MLRPPPCSTLFPYTTLFRSFVARGEHRRGSAARLAGELGEVLRSEEHTSELQSQSNLVCRLLLEKKKNGIQDRGPARSCPQLDENTLNCIQTKFRGPLDPLV